jgi:hypothetical protein
MGTAAMSFSMGAPAQRFPIWLEADYYVEVAKALAMLDVARPSCRAGSPGG